MADPLGGDVGAAATEGGVDFNKVGRNPALAARAKSLNIATARCDKDFLAKAGALIFTISR